MTDDPTPDEPSDDAGLATDADSGAQRQVSAPRSTSAVPVDDDDDFWDDDDWADRPRRQGGGVPPAWIVAGVVVVLLVIGVVVVSNGKDDSSDSGSAQPPASGGAKQCATWPAVGGLGEPPVATKPGIHLWSDYQPGGWHLRRVPGPGVPALAATVTATDSAGNAQPVTVKGAASGGGTATASDQRLTVTLPAGEATSQADFEPGVYSTTVIIQMNDDTGAALPPTAFTVGGGDKPPTNPVTATQVMVPCDE